MTRHATNPVAAESIELSPLIAVESATVRFGGLTALAGVSLIVPNGAIVGLVGPNGAGKTTLFQVICGLLSPNSGAVKISDTDVTRKSAQRRARMGLARTFQIPEMFVGMTVREHLLLADRLRHARSRLWTDLLQPFKRARSDEADRVDELVSLLSLGSVANVGVGALPLGTTRRVDVARALATEPKAILLDEPSSGLDLHETAALSDTLQHVVDSRGVALLLVEHDVAMVLGLSEVVYVLDFGQMIATGPPDVIRENPEVRAAYLGDGDIAVAHDHA